MLVRKNYYLYEENDEKQQGKRKLLGSVRLTRNGEQWTMEIQWKSESEAETLVTKAGEGELQLKIREKEIILGQERQKREFSQERERADDERIKKEQQPIEELEEHNVEMDGAQNKTEYREETHVEEKEISENTAEHREKELSENTEESIEENIEKDAVDTNSGKIEKQELPVTATENIREENQQEKEERQRKRQSQTVGEDMRSQADQEWELVRRSCHKVESCRELGEVYRINKGEFAVLPDAIKHILQNSFLVHGLMNYGYLLLFRMDEKMKQLGVGVPGVYYEKEKLVAEMFGFPQFWCDGKSNNGKFGYYLRIVS